MSDLIGRQLGPYEILEAIGGGGMAVAYRARQPSLNRDVAIKVLRTSLGDDQEFIERFRREALAAGAMKHPNILRIHDAGTFEGLHYIVMDYVTGGTLAKKLEAGPLPLERVIDITAQIADALDYAHTHGIVHRDLKPSNVLMDEEGRPLLADFGIAHLMSAEDRLTRTGATIGTPEYMSPEQSEGWPVDGRADIYSLGIMLYFMVTRRVPFKANTPAGTMYQIVHQPPAPPRDFNPSVPEWLESIILRALAKSPDDRFSTAKEMAQALREHRQVPLSSADVETEVYQRTPLPGGPRPGVPVPGQQPPAAPPPATGQPSAAPAPTPQPAGQPQAVQPPPAQPYTPPRVVQAPPTQPPPPRPPTAGAPSGAAAPGSSAPAAGAARTQAPIPPPAGPPAVRTRPGSAAPTPPPTAKAAAVAPQAGRTRGRGGVFYVSILVIVLLLVGGGYLAGRHLLGSGNGSPPAADQAETTPGKAAALAGEEPTATEGPTPTEEPTATEGPTPTEEPTLTPEPTSTPEPTFTPLPAVGVRIAILVPLTGEQPDWGEMSREGASMAIDEWNARGGLLGNPIVPIVEDSQCLGGPAMAAANKVIDQDSAHYIIGEVCSRASIPVSEIASAKKAVQISPSTTAAQLTEAMAGITKSFVFRACAVDASQGAAGAGFAVDTLKAQSAFVLINQTSDYAAGLAGGFEDAFIKRGGKIAGKETYAAGDSDFSAVLAKIAEAKPDVIYLPDTYSVANLVTAQAKDKGITAPFLGGDAWDSGSLDITAAVGSYYTVQFAAVDPRASVQDFVANFSGVYQRQPDAQAALAYDAANILLQAIKRANVDDPAQVKDALQNGDYTTVNGALTFAASHNPARPLPVMAVTDAGVQFKTVVNP